MKQMDGVKLRIHQVPIKYNLYHFVREKEFKSSMLLCNAFLVKPYRSSILFNVTALTPTLRLRDCASFSLNGWSYGVIIEVNYIRADMTIF